MLAMLVLLSVAAGVAGSRLSHGTTARTSAPGTGEPAAVYIDPSTTEGRIPLGFLGVSIEYWALEAEAGKDPKAVNPVLVRLLRELVPGQQLSLRIGGVTTDKTWWPVAGFAQPPGVNYSLNARRLAVMKALAQSVGARLIMGINLEADSGTLAADEARAMLTHIGSGRIQAFELGNEPELYGNADFGWYKRNGHYVPGRPPGYDLAAFIKDFAKIGAALPRGSLAGPAGWAGSWLTDLDQFIRSEPRLGLVTVHHYPLQGCFATPASPVYPTIARLLSPVASVGQAEGVVSFLDQAKADHVPFRIDEINTISCGNPPGIANTFAMALWALDALFADAQVGVDGVNIHTWPGAIYQLFTFQQAKSGWQGYVEPEYYGLLMFAQAAPAGSQLLETSSATDAIRAWTTRAPDGRIRVLLINDDTASAHVVSVNLPGSQQSGTLERLQAPSAAATSQVTLGGQRFAPGTETGLLTGQRRTETVSPSSGSYSVWLPAASAALLTLSRNPRPGSEVATADEAPGRLGSSELVDRDALRTERHDSATGPCGMSKRAAISPPRRASSTIVCSRSLTR